MAPEPGLTLSHYRLLEAIGYSLTGRKNEAIQLLDRSIPSGFSQRSWFERDTDLDPLRDDPRFRELLERMR